MIKKINENSNIKELIKVNNFLEKDSPLHQRFYKTQKKIIVQKQFSNKKDKKFFKKRDRKTKYYSKKVYWFLNDLIQEALTYLPDSKQKKTFIKKYNLKLRKKIYTPYQKAVILGLKNQRKLRRKRYQIIWNYKNQNLYKSNEKLFWDFFESRKIKQTSVSLFVRSHAKQIFTLKKVFRYFYGFLKNTILKKAYIKAKKTKNCFLNFYSIIENRLIVILFRLNFIFNILEGKQLIRHGFILVNNKKILFPNFKINPGDIIKINPKSYFKIFLKRYSIDEIQKLHFNNQETHVYKKFRLLKGLILYQIKHNSHLYIKHYPKIFFGATEIELKKNIDFHINSDDPKKALNTFVKMQKREDFLTKKFTNPFLRYYTDQTIDFNDNMPFDKKRYLVAFCSKM